jgi:protein-tyrosine phosphatase
MGGVKRGGGRHYNPPIDILILCTGNICRSPMAEALLRHKLELAGIDATVTSAGTWRAGEPAAGGSILAMVGRGLDLSPHVSTLLDIEAVHRADLVIAMAREHVREVVVLDPPSLAKTFTLKELVRRAEALGPTPLPFDRWLAHVGQGRQARQMLGASRDDDVADPIGQSDDRFLDTADELESLIDRLVPLLAVTAKVA